MYMWRAVGSEGEVLEILVQPQRDKAAALRHYIDGGANAEQTLKTNVADLAEVSLRQRVLMKVSDLSLATEWFGHPSALPVILGPVGLTGMLARRGEVQVAKTTIVKAILRIIAAKGRSSQMPIFGEPRQSVGERFAIRSGRVAEIAFGLGGAKEHPMSRHSQSVNGHKRLALGEMRHGLRRDGWTSMAPPILPTPATRPSPLLYSRW
jgi:FMN-dependent dehydrogenase